MLIFANKADKVKHLFGFLIAHFPGVYIDMHHEEMSPADQAIIRNDFREGLFDVLITTDCLAKGMNLQVDHVVNFECPYDQTRLFAARVGRLGSSGTQYCFYNPNSDFAMTDTFNKVSYIWISNLKFFSITRLQSRFRCQQVAIESDKCH
jgi:superfamily II DNA/RNA helicase